MLQTEKKLQAQVKENKLLKNRYLLREGSIKQAKIIVKPFGAKQLSVAERAKKKKKKKQQQDSPTILQ